MKKLTLAIDLDGVIHDKAHPVTGRRMGRPFDDAQAALAHFYRSGHTIIIFTVMARSDGGRAAVEDWLKYYELPFHEVTALKPNADIFVDDKAIRHIDWQTTKDLIHEQITHHNR